MVTWLVMRDLKDRISTARGGKQAVSPDGATGMPSGTREVSAGDMDAGVAEESGPPVNIQRVGMQTSAMEPAETAEPAEWYGSYADGRRYISPIQSDTDADLLIRNSWVISGVISAYLDNVYGRRPYAVPKADPMTPEGKQTIRQWMRMQRVKAGSTDKSWLDIKDSALDKVCRQIDARVELESALVDGFFATCQVDLPYDQMASLAGYDLEVRGRTFLEVLRDAPGGKPVGMVWSPARFIRVEPPSPAVGFSDLMVHNPLVYEKNFRFRRFVGCFQSASANAVSPVAFFKDFGDPRVRSRSDGRYYETMDQLLAREMGEEVGGYGGNKQRRWPVGTPSTEIVRMVHTAPWAALTGMAPWYSTKTELLGIRECAQENRGLLSGQLVPLLLWMIHGGQRITPDQTELWQKDLQAAVKPGERSVVIMQVMSDAMARAGSRGAGEPKSSIVNTRPAQQEDALAMKYTEQSYRTALRAYRMNRAALGDFEGMTQQEIQEALRYTETQVYGPRGESWCAGLQPIVDDLGLLATRLERPTRASLALGELSEILERLGKENFITPEQAWPTVRRAMKDLGRIVQDKGQWSKYPRRVVDGFMMARVPQAAGKFMGLDAKYMPPIEATDKMDGNNKGPVVPAPAPVEDPEDE